MNITVAVPDMWAFHRDLLAQHHSVTAVDILPGGVDQPSLLPIRTYIERYLAEGAGPRPTGRARLPEGRVRDHRHPHQL